MMQSRRRFNFLYLNWSGGDGNFTDDKIEKVLKRFGADIRKAVFNNISVISFERILEEIPNIEELTVYNRFRHQQSNVKVVELPKLKKLNLKHLESSSLDFFCKIIPGKTLRELDIAATEFTDSNAKRFLAQSNIKKLKIAKIKDSRFFGFKAIRHFQLDELIVESWSESEQIPKFVTFLRTQKKLEKVDLELKRIESLQISKIIDSLKSVKNLKLKIRGVLPEAMQKLSELRQLEELELKVLYLDDFEALKLVEIPAMKKLALHRHDVPYQSYEIHSETIVRLGNIFSNLRELGLYFFSIPSLNIILDNFSNLEILKVKGSGTRGSTKIFEFDDVVYENLKEFRFRGSMRGSAINSFWPLFSLPRVAPNLEVLEIKSVELEILDIDQICVVLESFSNLKSVFISSFYLQENFIVNDRFVEALKALGNLALTLNFEKIDRKKSYAHLNTTIDALKTHHILRCMTITRHQHFPVFNIIKQLNKNFEESWEEHMEMFCCHGWEFDF
jgi:hypothetical protein